MKHIKHTEKAKLKANTVVGDLDRAGEELYPKKSAKKNNSSSKSPRKEFFRPKNSQKSGLNGQKHTIRILIHLKKRYWDHFEGLEGQNDRFFGHVTLFGTLFFGQKQ